jgi:phosphoribosylformylglycinamidine (FGAM) synthase PurS component
MIFNATWGYMLGTGYSFLIFKRATTDCLLMLMKNIQSVYEVQQLKYMSLEMMDRDEKYIEFQKSIDEKELNSLKNTIVRNYINSVPPRYNTIIPFHDWNSAMTYLNEVLTTGENNDK